MLKRLLNELSCRLKITTTGPVLVRSGYQTVSGPDMAPVRTHRSGGTEVYLPGSSLKGVFRSHLEKIARTLHPGAVCDPFRRVADAVSPQGASLLCPEYADASCSDKFETRERGEIRMRRGANWTREKEAHLEEDTAAVYADSCPVCRLFGSQAFIGRLSIGDAYLKGSQYTEMRDGVGIDRVTGGAAHGAKFDLETVSAGVAFSTDILIRNFECWQLGMFLTGIADMADGLVRVGSGRSRGLGAVTADMETLSIHTLVRGGGRTPGEVWGLGKFLGEGTYGTFPDDQMTVKPAPVETSRGLRQVTVFEGDSLTALRELAIRDFSRRLESWQVPAGMKWKSDWRQAGQS